MPSFLIQFGVLTAMFVSVAAIERVPALQHTQSKLRRPWFETDVLWYLVAALSAGLSTFMLRPVLARLAVPDISSRIEAMPEWAASPIAAALRPPRSAMPSNLKTVPALTPSLSG